MSFRAATAADVPTLLILQEAFYRHENYPYAIDRARAAMGQLITDDSLGRMLVIEVENAIVGFMAIVFGFSLEFGGRDAFIDELYVSPQARSRGLGTEALAIAERVCSSANVVALHLEVEHENLRAIELYKRAGFFEHTRYLMTKRLD